MLNTSLKRKSLGFSLIELLIGIVILAITISMGLPSYSAWIQNTQIRNAAESIQNGLQRARAEAVKRNANVSFTLEAAAKTGWTIRDITAATDIETRSGNEGSKKVTRTVVPVAATAGDGTTTLTYGGLGKLVDNANGSVQATQINLVIATAASSRTLRISIEPMGKIRMCDPDANLLANSLGKC